jgi:hypothetical protein
VFVDQWSEAAHDAVGMVREELQRESIVHRWKEQGMRPDDIGLVGDVDEFFSRDFLRAAQACNIKEFEEPTISNCEKPKVVGRGITYESSPECRKIRKWWHPDMMLGACVDGIGDPTGRVVPVRKYHRTRGHRMKGYSTKVSPGWLPEILTLGRYPLWSTQDYREVEGGEQYRWVNYSGHTNELDSDSEFGISFHLHNFFNDLETLRHKYTTYGHGKKEAMYQPLSNFSRDLDVVVRCVHGLPNVNAWPKAVPMKPFDRFMKPYDRTLGPKPIFFLNATYRSARHKHVRQLVLEDEVKFGSSYTVLQRNSTSIVSL